MAWAPDYCTASELKSFVRIADSQDDAQIALAITAASRAVDRSCNRQFGLLASAEDRYYTAQWSRKLCRWVIDIDDLMTTTGLTVAYDADDDGSFSSDITEFRLLPVNAAGSNRPWTQIVVHPNSENQPSYTPDNVEVHAQFGWTSVPSPIKQATLLQASRLLARRDSPYGVAGSPDMGNELRLLAKLDPDVEVVVGPYRRWWGAV